MEALLKTLQEESKGLDTQAFLAYIVGKFPGKIALATSLSVEDQVVADMLSKISDNPNVFTLDTGRLPQATYDVIDQTREKYGFDIKITFPDTAEVEEMINNKGVNSFYKSVDNRKECCRIRKVTPLKKELAKLDAWITGLRKEQSVTRDILERVDIDAGNGLFKVNPLADWSETEVWDYIKENKIPYNTLHDKGYPSIGCEPCTRAIAEGEDVRAGRWWWETPEQKECGLHMVDGKLTKKNSNL
jgi:phosphoadenosine phosphosulfate reductase